MTLPGPAHADAGDPRTDAQLVDAANGGDVAAFEVLYRRHRDWVARLACRFTGDHDGALDVTQETFIYLLSKFPGLTLTGRLTTLLYPAVKHLARDWRRKRDRLAPGTAPLETVPAAAPPTPDADRAEVDALLASLSEAHREVLLMRFVDGMRLEEIAAALDLPLGTVKSRLHHALAAARERADRKRRR